MSLTFFFTTFMLKKISVFSFLVFLGISGQAQLMNYYWGHSFNSTSSLLGGAVIAGEADNTAIFYNPATISEMQKGNNLSLSANLFTWNFYNFKNALGDDINLQTDNFLVQPQFLSYSYKPPRKGLSVSVAIMTRVKERMEIVYNHSEYYDVLTRLPGDEQYNTTYHYRNDYSDTWIGGAVSHQVNDRFSYGASLFISLSSLKYNFGYSASATNWNDTVDGVGYSTSAESEYREFIKFTDYRVLLKFGMAYNAGNWKLGFTLTSPSMRVFSSGKQVERIQRQTGIARGDVPPGFSDFVIFDGQEGNQLTTNYKMPFSTGVGYIHDFNRRGQKLYISMEYFGKLKMYKAVKAQMNPNITSPEIYDTLSNKDWTSFTFGANSVLNIAVGYSWTLSNDLIFLNAIRTDFSAVNKLDINEVNRFNVIKTTTYNIYHYSGGVEFTLKRNRFITGADLAFGFKKNLRQMANFTDPVEYNEDTGRVLQGPQMNNMDMFFFGINIYLGATLNFIKKKPDNKK